MRIRVATVLMLSVLVVLTGCAGRGHKPDEIQTVKVVYRDRLVPAPCTERVSSPVDVFLLPVGDAVEDLIDALILSDSRFRQYVPELEAAAQRCGVTIAR